ncbi:MAG: HAD-IIA family hydrolase [Bacteroidota bacterium]
MIALDHFKTVASQYKAVFLDSYGVLKNAAGIIPGVPEALDFLKSKSIPFYVLTNDASRGPEELVFRFHERGLKGIKLGNMVSSGMMTRDYLQHKLPGATIAYLGTKSSASYLQAVGLTTIAIEEVEEESLEQIRALAFLDDEGFDWQKGLNRAINLLRKINVPVVIANSDLTYPSSRTEVSMAIGGLANLVESISGKAFLHFGKPDGRMFLYAYDQLHKEGFQVDKREVLMVGDTLQTDIICGNKFGFDTMLTLSGNTTAHQAEALIRSTGIIPDYIVHSIGDDF